ncbi:DUF423 domain-containing protein [Enterobacter cloacae subsp. cloacae]|nr:DUF423 domain-containing protein [Enterobacter cloacae subsp. cloacae]
MTSRFMLIFCRGGGFIFVALGAFGAHVISRVFGYWWRWAGSDQTGLEYRTFHTLAIFGLAVAMQRRISIWFYWAAFSWRWVRCCSAAALLPCALAFAPVGVCCTPVGGVSFWQGG